jgi:peptidoglycan/xylan/chitin deacetylase (PgdA/CDA1 family)
MKRRAAHIRKPLRRLFARPTVLMYHRVADGEMFDPWGLSVSVRRFDEQLRWLKQHRQVLPLPEFGRRKRSGDIPASAIAITFDDGYACNATVAAPLLAIHGLPATVFVTSRPILTGREFWWDDLQRIVASAPEDRVVVKVGELCLSVELGDPSGGAAPWRAGDSPSNARQEGFLSLWRLLRSLNPTLQDAVLENLREQTGIQVSPRPSHRPMTCDELRGLLTSGLIEIGSHTVTHAALSDWPVATQRIEIEEGRSTCAAMIGRVPTSFAYPYGDNSPKTTELVRSAGFDIACTTESAPVTARCDVLALPRLQVGDWPPNQLERVLRSL